MDVTRRTKRKLKRTFAAAGASAVVIGGLLILVWPAPEKWPVTLTIGVDRSISSAGVGEWPEEVEATVREAIIRGHEDGVDQVVIYGIGNDLGDTAVIASGDLDLNCTTDRKCEQDVAAKADQFAEAALRAASTPIADPGTDILAGLITGRQQCGDDVCRMLVLTDLQDSRLADPGLDVKSIEMPSFEGVPVQFVGLGVDSAPDDATAAAKSFFDELLIANGTTPSITRNFVYQKDQS